jgi:hypothetical protein
MRTLSAAGVGVGFLTVSGTTAAVESPDSYDRRWEPGNRDLGYSLRIVNRESGGRTATVTITKIVPETDNQVVVSRTFDLAASPSIDVAEPTQLNLPNDHKVMLPTGLVLGASGLFEVEVSLDDGRSDTALWRVPDVRVPPNRAVTVNIERGELSVRTRVA